MSGEYTIFSNHAGKHSLLVIGLVSLSGIGLFQVIFQRHHIFPARGRTSSAR